MLKLLLVAVFCLHLVCAKPEEREMVFRDMLNNLVEKGEVRRSNGGEMTDEEIHPSEDKREFKKRSTAALDASEIQEYVDAHNEFRRQTTPTAGNIRYMKWSDELAAVAASWAETCNWSHNPDRSSDSPSFGYVGENKYLTTSTANKIHRSVEYWWLENSKYDFDTQTCSSGICSHYTQVVWHDSEYVGCGVQFCPSMNGLSGWNDVTFYVCNYGPGGNYAGQDPYTEGSDCSGCPDDCCKDGLCVINR
ncbi:GLIPR1-like protein 1 [Saccostrea echinata]|uniref:GLIPR1-like protein 1 n=1 Tax=Saccostrea echinata TaxID=191078 RepID=UPI002A840AAD|nr:GLIPR1-like protein 1 [Saccostrea echinata]